MFFAHPRGAGASILGTRKPTCKDVFKDAYSGMWLSSGRKQQLVLKPLAAQLLTVRPASSGAVNSDMRAALERPLPSSVLRVFP